MVSNLKTKNIRNISENTKEKIYQKVVQLNMKTRNYMKLMEIAKIIDVRD